jgi:serpin B
MKPKLANSLLILVLLTTTGCAGALTPSPVPPSPEETLTPPAAPTQAHEGEVDIVLVSSEKPRDTSPQVTETDIKQLVTGNNRFALDLYQSVRHEDGNLFYSPYSISVALAMTYAGARGNTAQEIADALHFTLPGERLHPAFNQLDLELNSRSKGIPEEDEGRGFTLNILNSLWGQEGYDFLPEFLDILAENYTAGLRLLDFARAPEAARQLINEWVMEQTNDRIEDLLPPGTIDELTRLVLVNAIYFNAGWDSPFNEQFTRDADFMLLDGSTVQVPRMSQEKIYSYTTGSDFQAVELPYYGFQTSMLILHPDRQAFEDFESDLEAEKLEEILAELSGTNMILSIPKFEFEMSLPVTEGLKGMGMVEAFLPVQADFSGMDGTRDLFIDDIIHKAFVSVDEEGTEAAAATAVEIGVTSMPAEPVYVTIDSPFIFLIRDRESGSILFMGRVLNPG